MELRLSLQQKQILSQRMQLAVKILQMNALDLDQHIRESALENPLIELELPQETEDPAVTRLKKLEWLDKMDDSSTFRQAVNHDEDDRFNIPLYEKNEVVSLEDVLLQQLPALRLDEELERIVRYLIGNLDENGYISMSREMLLAELPDVEEEQLEQAMQMLRKMEPAGVGAENLRDCLLIQAKRMKDPSPLLIELIEDHLDLLAKNQLAKLAKALHTTIDEVKEIRAHLLTLNPKPGNGYASYKLIPYFRPDLFIVRFEDSFQVILNDYNQPKIEINSYYRTLSKDANSETATYINDKLNKAEWLISCIHQRKGTVLRCASSILGRQMRFFEQGPGNLAPMTLADVANDLEMHPSTISRAVRGKYLQCQWGVFALSDFFSRSLSVSDNNSEETSQDMALNQIKRIIEEENPCKPFSDQEITLQLQKHGINIARRTVAKYREQLNLPPASGRKKFD